MPDQGNQANSTNKRIKYLNIASPSSTSLEKGVIDKGYCEDEEDNLSNSEDSEHNKPLRSKQK